MIWEMEWAPAWQPTLAAEPDAEKVVAGTKSEPSGAEARERFHHLVARAELVPFPFVERLESFSKL